MVRMISNSCDVTISNNNMVMDNDDVMLDVGGAGVAAAPPTVKGV